MPNDIVDLVPVLEYQELRLLSADDEAFLALKAEQIRAVAANAVYEIGRHLIEAKDRVDHGNFLGWINREFPEWSSRQTAVNYMSVAKQFSNVQRIGHLNMAQAALYLLAGPNVPETAREAAVAKAEEGIRITKTEAEKLIAEKSQEAINAAIAKYRASQKGVVDLAVQNATARLTRDNENLRNELERLQEDEEEPDTEAICRMVEKSLGIKKLSDAQYRALAETLGQTIVVGRKSYSPASRNTIMKSEEHLRIASKITEAFEVLAGAPPPDAVIDATWPVQRKQHRRLCAGVIEWLQRYYELLEINNEGGE